MALCPGAHFGQVCPGGLIRPPARLRAWPACISQGRCYVWERDFFLKEKPLSGLRVFENLMKAREALPSQAAPVHTLRETSETWPAGISGCQGSLSGLKRAVPWRRPWSTCHCRLWGALSGGGQGPGLPSPLPSPLPHAPGECHPHPTPSSSLLPGNVFCSKNGFSDPTSVTEPILAVPRCLPLCRPPGPREVSLSRGDPKAGRVERTQHPRTLLS